MNASQICSTVAGTLFGLGRYQSLLELDKIAVRQYLRLNVYTTAEAMNTISGDRGHVAEFLLDEALTNMHKIRI